VTAADHAHVTNNNNYNKQKMTVKIRSFFVCLDLFGYRPRRNEINVPNAPTKPKPRINKPMGRRLAAEAAYEELPLLNFLSLKNCLKHHGAKDKLTPEVSNPPRSTLDDAGNDGDNKTRSFA
jgi:hypothetical protein